MAKITPNDIHVEEAIENGVVIVAPGLAGLLGGAFMAKPDKVAWLEEQGYVISLSEDGTCVFTEAGSVWLDGLDDAVMDEFFYAPDDAHRFNPENAI